MLSAKQLAAVQKVGQNAMTVSADIYKRLAYAGDDDNPYGDDTVRYAATATRVKGWVVPLLGGGFTLSAAQVISVGEFGLRVPVGTDIQPGDRVVIGGKSHSVTDTTVEQTWPEWTTARLRRVK
jgi:hypothetical protein